ncbi:MAG TPA: hypothetical protein VEA99_06795 [Gemmatimonadaceae bacterium]|nr:hypothetical protein [Gemmatimonadaceae bacterium]
MKKDEAVERMDRVGAEINGMYASAWNTALNPTQFGWARSIVGVASIPVLSFASIGHMVGSAVVRQVSPNVIEKLTELPGDEGKTPPR